MTTRKSSGSSRITQTAKRDPLSTRGGKVPSGGKITGLKPPSGGSKPASGYSTTSKSK